MIDNDFGLGSYDREYEAIKTIDRRATVPDGKYDVRVVDVILDRDPQQNTRFTLALEVEDGEHSGTVLTLDNHFYDSRKLEYTKKALVGLGLGHLKPSDLQRQETRSALVGIRASISCVTKAGKSGGNFFNIYINRRLPDDVASELPKGIAPPRVLVSATDADDRDLPF